MPLSLNAAHTERLTHVYVVFHVFFRSPLACTDTAAQHSRQLALYPDPTPIPSSLDNSIGSFAQAMVSFNICYEHLSVRN